WKNVTRPSTRSANLGLCSRMLKGPRTLPNTSTTASTTWWCSAGTSDFPVTGATLGMGASSLERDDGERSMPHAGTRCLRTLECTAVTASPRIDRNRDNRKTADRRREIGCVQPEHRDGVGAGLADV